ncbi:MAG: DUF4974 domain-containing protein [Rikenellaceae bacterium]|nr:DUF4974 domain-containing protein [Rikenellaceae bacterium]
MNQTKEDIYAEMEAPAVEGNPNDESWAIALRMLDSMRGPSAGDEVMEDKQAVWDKVSSGITGTGSFRYKTPRWFFPIITGVAATLIFGLLTGLLTYRAGYTSGTEQIARNNIEVVVPMGAATSLTLPDGTDITLNGGSRLVYPAYFGRERWVELDGEALFNVEADPDRPFTVKSPGVDILVTGTVFTFKSYRTDPLVSVVLEQGEVRAIIGKGPHAESVSLYPGQQVLFHRGTGEISRLQTEPSRAAAWTEGLFYFRSTPLEDICRQLERRFGVEIEIEDRELARKEYHTQFESHESLHEILDVLSYKNRWKAVTDGRKIVIRPVP